MGLGGTNAKLSITDPQKEKKTVKPNVQAFSNETEGKKKHPQQKNDPGNNATPGSWPLSDADSARMEWKLKKPSQPGADKGLNEKYKATIKAVGSRNDA